MHYNPHLPEVKANLCAHYAYLREYASVYWVESLQAWAVSRYDDVVYVLKNPQLFSSSVFFNQLLGEFNPRQSLMKTDNCSPPENRPTAIAEVALAGHQSQLCILYLPCATLVA